MSRMNYTDEAGNTRQCHTSWYRGEHLNFIPSKTDLQDPEALDKYILKGWVPDEPILTYEDKFLAVGSCFASHIARWLTKQKKMNTKTPPGQPPLIRHGAGFVNTFTLRQQFEWALKGIEPHTRVLVEKNKGEFLNLDIGPRMKAKTKKLVLASDAFILTLGLSEVWYEKETGAVFFSAVPEKMYDSEKHAFRVSTVEENLQNLRAILGALREVKPEAPVVFTLSPVPLIATFRPISCITANQVSKAILRVAVDELLRESNDPNLYYWPSYEIVLDYFGPNAYMEDRRHIFQEVIDTIMEAFARKFIKP